MTFRKWLSLCGAEALMAAAVCFGGIAILYWWLYVLGPIVLAS